MTQDWIARNPRARRDMPYGAEQRRVIDPDGVPELLRQPRRLPRAQADAAACPCRPWRRSSASASCGSRTRASASASAPSRRWAASMPSAWRWPARCRRRHGTVPSLEELMRDKHRDDHRGLHLRDGELGQPRPLGRGRRQAVRHALRRLPAEIHLGREGSGDPRARRRGDPHRRRLRGSAVAQCRRQSQANGWTIISDTSWDGYEDTPRDVMRGYTVLAEEVLRQWPAGPTHVFVQAGVGGLAAAVIGYLWARCTPRPQFIVVEPESADCWLQSNRGGQADARQRQRRHRDGRPRLPRDLADHLAGRRPRRRLVHDHRRGPGRCRRAGCSPIRMDGDPAIASGPSGCAGLAGLVRVCTDQAAVEALQLDKALAAFCSSTAKAISESKPA